LTPIPVSDGLLKVIHVGDAPTDEASLAHVIVILQIVNSARLHDEEQHIKPRAGPTLKGNRYHPKGGGLRATI
jgi:hypothetical protein